MHKCSYVHLDICAAGWGWLRAAEEGAMARLAGLRARLGGAGSEAHRAVPQGALSGGHALELYDGNNNGRITCADLPARVILDERY